MTSKRMPLLWAALPLVLSGLAVAPAGPAAAQDVSLRLHNFNSPKAISNRAFLVPWAKRVGKASGGRIKITIFPAMQLGGKPSDLYGQARDGVVDMIWTLPGYSPGRFPLTEVFELPFVGGTATATSLALNEFYKKWLRDEYKDTQPLVFHATAPGHIHTTRTPVRRLEDLQGLKIRAFSRNNAKIVKALGAVPVGMPVPKVYEAISRGVVEGTWVPWTIMRPFRLQEVTKYHTELHMSSALFVLAMNKKRYESLPADLRKVIDDHTGMALAREVGKLWQDDELPGRNIALKRGNKIFTLSEAELERWRTATQPVIDAWVEEVTKAGHDGRAMLADARRLVAKYSN